MTDAGDNSWASSWAAELCLSSFDYDQPITQTQQDSSSSWFPSQPYYPSSCYPHRTGSSSDVTNPVPQQQYNDEFLNLSLSCGNWSDSSHQSKGKEPASYSYNNQKPVNDEPYYSPYTSSSSYFTNLLPQQQENDEFLNLSLSFGDWSGSSHQSKGKELADQDGFGAGILHNQALDHVSTQLTLGRDFWTTDERHWSIRKKLKISDIDNNSRLLLPLESMREHILPLWDADFVRRIKRGVGVAVWDCDTKSEHHIIFKQKSYGNDVRYMLQKHWIKDFVKRRSLKKGDEIGLYWDSIGSRFNFCVFD